MENANRRKVVVVTGASAGVGRAVVTEFARQGAHIGLIARGRERLDATKREVEELGGKALVLPTDVADAQQVEVAAERVERELGPEVAARAIVWAAGQKRREVYVGWPTVEAVYAQGVAPAFADRYLAKNCFDGQQTSEPVSPDRPDNLFESVPGEYSAHGIFDNRASNFSVQSLMNLKLINLSAHRGLVALAGMAVTGLLFAALRKRG